MKKLGSAEKSITELYKQFFKEVGINQSSGTLKNNTNLKFASYPFIGSKYFSTRPRILFVGLDLGKDESPSILPFREKRKAVEEMEKLNTHIAGTYITALYFYKKNWSKIKKEKSYQAAAKVYQEINKDNPLCHVALINLYKFVTKKRKLRSGGIDRRHINEQKEIELLLAEVRVLNPDIIIFQSVSFKETRFKAIFANLHKQNEQLQVFVIPHPCYHGSHVPETYISTMEIM